MKVRLNVFVWMEILLRGIVLLGALAAMFTPGELDIYKTVIYMVAGGFIFSGIIRLLISIFVYKHGSEKPDERDVEIENKAANLAISLTSLTILLLLFAFVAAHGLMSIPVSKAILFALFGAFLPLFYKNCMILYYQNHSEMD